MSRKNKIQIVSSETISVGSDVSYILRSSPHIGGSNEKKNDTKIEIPDGGFPPIYILKKFSLGRKIKKREFASNKNFATIGKILEPNKDVTPFISIGGTSSASSSNASESIKSMSSIHYDSIEF
jgi:hypothetical protein